MRWNPEVRSGQWWIYAGISSLLVSILLWLIRFVVLGQPFTAVIAFRFMLLGIILCFLFSFMGWLGAKRLWLFANIGMMLGLILMALYSRDKTGWEDLVSLLFFFQAVAAGIVIGLIVEGIGLIVRLTKKKFN
ncbi:hypothetical protein [Paenibacillus sp. sgz302251]|uniref:hypothetical protein n=1 Tax=Paenibacillus sp. sgz302251 TaxID=3414493 RepID=UPI003C7CB268